MASFLTAEISAQAIRGNLQLIRDHIAPGVKICAVVKADCYGHGLELLVGLISEKADCLGIATAQEAILLRDLGYERPILMLLPASAWINGKELSEALEYVIRENVTLTVASTAELDMISKAAERVRADAMVHMKIDSGMTRGGTLPGNAPDLVAYIKHLPNVKLTGMYTHFAVADEADKSFTLNQLAQFKAAVDSCGGHGGLTLHAANSAATLDVPQTHLDMVRPGIAIYGYHPSDEIRNRLPLQPCMRLTSRLIQVKDVLAGSSCGYGLTYTFRRDGRMGIVPIGYGDGYFRSFSNRATMRVCGVDVPIRGRVSMDQVIVDLTDVPQARLGEEVEIISPDRNAPHSVENLARIAGTIPYEVTCRLGFRVRRVLVD